MKKSLIISTWNTICKKNNKWGKCMKFLAICLHNVQKWIAPIVDQYIQRWRCQYWLTQDDIQIPCTLSWITCNSSFYFLLLLFSCLHTHIYKLCMCIILYIHFSHLTWITRLYILAFVVCKYEICMNLIGWESWRVEKTNSVHHLFSNLKYLWQLCLISTNNRLTTTLVPEVFSLWCEGAVRWSWTRENLWPHTGTKLTANIVRNYLIKFTVVC